MSSVRITDEPTLSNRERSAAPPGGSLSPSPQREGDLRTHLRQGALGLVDQAVVSGTQFLTTVMIGRACGKEELGVFTLAFSFFVIAMGVQNSFVILPYTIYTHRLKGADRQTYARSVVVHQGLLALLAAVLCAVAGWGLQASSWLPGLGSTLGALAAVSPLLLFRQFFRHMYLAHLQVVAASLLDMATCILQLLALIWLAAWGWLSPASSYVVMGSAAALAAIICCWGQIRHLQFSLQKVRESWELHWDLGKWTFANTMAALLQSYCMYWILAIVCGAAETGQFAACMSIIAVSNPFVIGISNTLYPQASVAYAQGGSHALQRVVSWATRLLALGIGTLCLGLALGGAFLVPALYGAQYGGQGPTIALLAAGILLRAVGIGPDIGLLTLERARETCLLGGLGLLCTVAASCLAVMWWGATGCAAAFLLGNLVTTGLRYPAFRRAAEGVKATPAELVIPPLGEV